MFQQDGAPAHRANKTREFLEDQVILLLGDLHWPANSPDLNVIEHLWGIIKAKIDLTKVSNLDELFIEAKRVWDEIPMEVINNLIDSFQDRIKACRLLAGESLNGKKNLFKNLENLMKTEYSTFRKGMMKSDRSMILFLNRVVFLVNFQDLI